MRTLKLQVQLSIDGFIAGPKGAMDWMQWDWDDELKQYVNDLTEPVDCIVLGRKLATGFIPYWADIATKEHDPQFEFGKKMTEVHKVVFTNTIEKSDWENTILAKGDLEEEISKLKQQPGKDIIVYGGAKFVSSLIEADLIDEYHLFINPTALGDVDGLSIFNKRTSLELVSSQAFDCGIVLLHYQPGN